MKIKYFFICLAVVMLSAGCVFNLYKESLGTEELGPNDAFIYGYFDDGNENNGIQWVKVLMSKNNEKNQARYWAFAAYAKKGFFFNGRLTAPSKYQITGLWNGYDFSLPGGDIRVIDKPGIYYYGAYKLARIDYVKETFVVENTGDVDECDVLLSIINLCKGSRWEARLKERLAKICPEKAKAGGASEPK